MNTMAQSERKGSSARGQSIQIKIKTMNGSITSLTVPSTASIHSIQLLVEQKIGVPIEAQRLLHKAVLLESNKHVSDYSINDGNTIQLVANMLPQEISSPSISTHRQSQVARTHALTQQNLRTKKHRYLQQRINGFSFKNRQSVQVLKQNKATLDRLLGCLNNSKDELTQPFIMKDRQLYVGDWVDVRDVSGLWVEGQVVGKKHNFVEIHCNGYPDRWNQWVDQSSERIMPFRTQTVQSEDCSYLSPCPINKPQIKLNRNPDAVLQKLLTELPETLDSMSWLLNEMESGPKSKTNQKKYSYHEQQQEEEQIAESFKNNRSHNSPPHSIHEQEYEYDYENDDGEIPKTKQNKQIESGSIKGKILIKNGRKFIRSNRYIDTNNAYLGYSKTKSEHEHTLNHRQQTPNKNGSVMIDEQRNITYMKAEEEGPTYQQQYDKEEQMDIEEYVQTPKTQMLVEMSNAYSETVIPTANKAVSSIQADNISNKCQQNMSNKGDHDDGESSAKSFGSKRSDRFLDASSMKSLNIDTLHNDNETKKEEKNAHGKKNIFVFDHSEAQSVRSAVQNQDIQTRSNYYYNQEGILEEQDSQINEQINEEYYMQKKKQAAKRLRATQLAPLCDRLGRMLVDLAPHLANMGYKEYNASLQFSENLSTFTNQGSLQSRFRTFNPPEQDEEEKSSRHSSKYCNFQIPVMLTPWEIMKINKFLAQENRPENE